MGVSACPSSAQIIDTLSESAVGITVVQGLAFGVVRVATPLCSILRQVWHSSPRCSILRHGVAFFTEVQRSAPLTRGVSLVITQDSAVLSCRVLRHYRAAFRATNRAAFRATAMQRSAPLPCSSLLHCHAAFCSTAMQQSAPRLRGLRRPHDALWCIRPMQYVYGWRRSVCLASRHEVYSIEW